MKKKENAYDTVKAQFRKLIEFTENRKNSKLTDEEHRLLEYDRIINQETPDFLIKVNPFFKNKYIPLQNIEMMLHSIFGGYEVSMPSPILYAEETITICIQLSVKHPVTKEVLKSTGISAIPLKPLFGKLSDVHYHVPAAKSYAIMNAALHLGRIFRAQSDDYTDVFKTYFTEEVVTPGLSKEDEARMHLKTRLLKIIASCKSFDSLTSKTKDIIDFDDEEVTKAFHEASMKLMNKPKS